MKKYVEALKESLYYNKITIALFYLILTLIAMYIMKTPIEKVLATYIGLDIIGMFVMVGILSKYNIFHPKKYHKKGEIWIPEGLLYAGTAALIYAIMYYFSNYKTHTIMEHILNTAGVLVLTIPFVIKLKSYRKIYNPIIKKTYLNEESFKRLYMFNNYDNLKIEYRSLNKNDIISIQKNDIRVEENFIYMKGVKYPTYQYMRYMKENEIATLEDLTENDKILIAMINIH